MGVCSGHTPGCLSVTEQIPEASRARQVLNKVPSRHASAHSAPTILENFRNKRMGKRAPPSDSPSPMSLRKTVREPAKGSAQCSQLQSCQMPTGHDLLGVRFQRGRVRWPPLDGSRPCSQKNRVSCLPILSLSFSSFGVTSERAPRRTKEARREERSSKTHGC